jgi:hypothetical protein
MPKRAELRHSCLVFAEPAKQASHTYLQVSEELGLGAEGAGAVLCQQQHLLRRPTLHAAHLAQRGAQLPAGYGGRQGTDPGISFLARNTGSGAGFVAAAAAAGRCWEVGRHNLPSDLVSIRFGLLSIANSWPASRPHFLTARPRWLLWPLKLPQNTEDSSSYSARRAAKAGSTNHLMVADLGTSRLYCIGGSDPLTCTTAAQALHWVRGLSRLRAARGCPCLAVCPLLDAPSTLNRASPGGAACVFPQPHNGNPFLGRYGKSKLLRQATGQCQVGQRASPDASLHPPQSPRSTKHEHIFCSTALAPTTQVLLDPGTAASSQASCVHNTRR